MAYFRELPYTMLQQLNLDWLIKGLQELETDINNFVALNTIKYANPFNWDITTQYAMNTLVFNPADYTAYLSVKPVPSGVQIDNTDYWTPVFTLEDVLTAYRDAITPVFEKAGSPATTMIEQGQLFWIDSGIYYATAKINQGDTVAIGTNCAATNISAELLKLAGLITAEQSAREDADSALQNAITAEQVAREDADSTLQNAITAEQVARENADNILQSKIGLHIHALEWFDRIIYVSDTGDDSNPGSESNPLKSLDAAIEKIQGYGAVGYIFITTPGTYDMYFPTFNSIQLHIVVYSPGVKIIWHNGKNISNNYTRAFYNTYLHLEGYNFSTITNGSQANTELFLSDPIGGGVKNAYLESGKLSIRGMVVNGTENTNFGVVSAFSTVDKCTFKIPFRVAGGQSYIANSVFICGNTNTAYTAALVVNNGSFAILESCTFNENSEGSNYTYGAIFTNSFIFVRTGFFNNLSNVKNVYWSYCYVGGSKGTLTAAITNAAAVTNCVVNGEFIPTTGSTYTNNANAHGTVSVNVSGGTGTSHYNFVNTNWSGAPYIVATVQGAVPAQLSIANVSTSGFDVYVKADSDNTYNVKWFATGDAS